MANPLVEQPDVEAVLLRSLTDTEEQFIDTLCQQASVKLRAALPALDNRLDAFPGPSGINPDAVSAMLAGVIAQFMVNPTGATSTSEAVGPASVSSSWSSNGNQFGRGGQLIITAADLAQLEPISSFTLPGTIRTTPRHWTGCA